MGEPRPLQRFHSIKALFAQPWTCFRPSYVQDKLNHPYPIIPTMSRHRLWWPDFSLFSIVRDSMTKDLQDVTAIWVQAAAQSNPIATQA